MHSIFDDCLTADASLNGSWTEFFKKKGWSSAPQSGARCYHLGGTCADRPIGSELRARAEEIPLEQGRLKR